jgi:hypothetical protein
MPRPVQDLERAVPQLQALAVAQRPRHFCLCAPGPEGRGHGLERVHDVRGDAVAQHHAAGELVVARGVLAEVLGETGQLVDRRHLRPGMPDDDVHQSQVVDVLVRQDHELDVVDRPSVPGELVLELVERAPGVGTRVDQRQRAVLDQVGVDPPDGERRGDPQQMYPGLGGARKRRLGGERLTHVLLSAPRRCGPPSPPSWIPRG